MTQNIDFDSLYDDVYYQSHCSETHEPYERSDLWLQQFANVAEQIIRSISPKNVLDAGCAWGFLVESLRDRGVNAFGIDISSYAISQVRQDVQKYCSVRNLIEPISGGPYDLITCIEVLEHLPEDMSDTAIANLCAAGEAILFSSSPDDFDEPTHFNVNPSIYWLRRFAAHNFAPDITHDASYLTPHAVLLRRQKGPINDDVLILHARKQMLNNELERLKRKNLKKDHDHQHALAEAQTRTHAANLALIRATDNERELRKKITMLEQITHSISWKITKPLRLVGRVVRALRPLFPTPMGFADRTEAHVDTLNTNSWLLIKADVKGDPSKVRIAVLDSERNIIPVMPLGRSGNVMRWIFKATPDTGLYEARTIHEDVSYLGFYKVSSLFSMVHIFRERFKQYRLRGGSLTPLTIMRVLKNSRYMPWTLINKDSSQIDYQTWITVTEACNDGCIEKARAFVKTLPKQPLISIIMPTYKSDIGLLAAAIGSIKSQVYGNWELCIADDGSNAPDLIAFLRDQEALEPRISVVYREQNGHISNASNSALSIAKGDYVGLMDHDDELHVFALACLVSAINDHPKADIFYSDEDKIDAQGNRYDPYFKTDWNPDLLLSQNYISHFGVYRRSLLEKIGGFREGFEGSQDYDLLLRATDDTSNVQHIPHILYHWRAVDGSTALNANEKEYAATRAIAALEDTLKRRKINAEVVETGFSAYHRIRYSLPDQKPLVSLIVPTRDRADLLEVCMDGLLNKTSYDQMEIIIVDNNSSEYRTYELFETLKQDARVRVLTYPYPFNYSAINNFAVGKATGKLVGLINNDIEIIHGDWLDEMVSHALRPGVGAVGARLYYPNDTVQHDGIVIGIGGVAAYAHPMISREDPGLFGRSRIIQNYSAVTAAALVVRKELYDAVGGFDEENLTVAFNDVDFCLKLQAAGHRNVFTPFAELYHHESVSRGSDTDPEKAKRFRGEVSYMQERWAEQIKHDPFYNPNLSLKNSGKLDPKRFYPYPWDKVRGDFND